MNNKTRNFIRSLKSIELSKRGHLDMRARLMSYTTLHGVPVQARRTLIDFDFSFLSVLTSRPAYALYTFVLFFGSLGTGISFAAEKSLPGEALYGVKVAVAEPLAETLAPSVQVRAHLHAVHAARRVAEATTLASRGELTADKAAQLTTALAKETQSATDDADTLAVQGDVAASIAARTYLETSLDTDASALASAASTTPSQIGTTTQSVLAHVQTTVRAVAAARFQREAAFALGINASSTPSVDLALLREEETKDTPTLGKTGLTRTLPSEGSPRVTLVRAALMAKQATTTESASTTAEDQNEMTLEAKRKLMQANFTQAENRTQGMGGLHIGR